VHGIDWVAQLLWTACILVFCEHFLNETLPVQEQEVEVSSAICSGAELLLRVTCKCGVHKEFSFDHGV
jgi:hypothetical protein